MDAQTAKTPKPKTASRWKNRMICRTAPAPRNHLGQNFGRILRPCSRLGKQQNDREKTTPMGQIPRLFQERGGSIAFMICGLTSLSSVCAVIGPTTL